MKKSLAIKLVEKQLVDLGCSKKWHSYDQVSNNAIEAADILTRKEVIKLIEDDLNLRGFYHE